MATAISSINWQTDIKDTISVYPSTPTDKLHIQLIIPTLPIHRFIMI
jgi:hypothetical protein